MIVYIHIDELYVCIDICVVSSRRNKTNPHHGNKYIPVLLSTHLQAFKPKQASSDQPQKAVQQDVIEVTRA